MHQNSRGRAFVPGERAPRLRWAVAAIVMGLLTLPVQSASAQKPPGLGYSFPPVVEIGKTTEVKLGGFDWTPDCEWFSHDEHVQLAVLGLPGDYHVPPPPYWFGPRASNPAMPIPREVDARWNVAATATPGLVRWQVANANGSSGTAMLLLSQDRECLESRSRDFPQRLLELPIAVSGRLSRLTEVDRYVFRSDRQGLITVELWARRLGSDFLPTIQVRDHAGSLIVDVADSQGLEVPFSFPVEAGEEYALSLHDVDFRGDRAYVYRLALRYGPNVDCMLPAAGQRGIVQSIEFVGVGIATRANRLESIRQDVQIPADPSRDQFLYALQTPFGSVSVTIPISDFVENRLTTGPNPSAERAEGAGAEVTSVTVAAAREQAIRESAQPIPMQIPSAMTRRLWRPHEEHRYQLTLEKDQYYSVDLQSRAIGGRLDVALRILGPDGQTVAEGDDSGGTTDAQLEFRAANSGLHTCIVRSVGAHRGDLDEIYRLAVARPQPDFALTIPQQLNLSVGGQVELPVQASRSGGIDSEIMLTVVGLPAGVTAEGELKIAAGKTETKVLLKAAADSAVVARPISVRGTAAAGEQVRDHGGSAGAAGNLSPRRPGDSRVARSMLAMTMPAPFEIHVVDRERQHDVHRGTTFLAELEIERKAGFQGELRLEMSAQQDRYRQGTRGPIVLLPPGADKAVYPCFLPEWLGTDLTRRIVIHGVGIVNDPRGTPRHLTRAAGSRITMIMEGALLKLNIPGTEFIAAPGAAFEVPVIVARSAKLPLPVTIALDVPEELRGSMRADPLELGPGEDRGNLRIATSDDPRLEGPWSLRIVATALQDGRWPVVSESAVSVNYQR